MIFLLMTLISFSPATPVYASSDSFVAYVGRETAKPKIFRIVPTPTNDKKDRFTILQELNGQWVPANNFKGSATEYTVSQLRPILLVAIGFKASSSTGPTGNTRHNADDAFSNFDAQLVPDNENEEVVKKVNHVLAKVKRLQSGSPVNNDDVEAELYKSTIAIPSLVKNEEKINLEHNEAPPRHSVTTLKKAMTPQDIKSRADDLFGDMEGFRAE